MTTEDATHGLSPENHSPHNLTDDFHRMQDLITSTENCLKGDRLIIEFIKVVYDTFVKKESKLASWKRKEREQIEQSRGSKANSKTRIRANTKKQIDSVWDEIKSEAEKVGSTVQQFNKNNLGGTPEPICGALVALFDNFKLVVNLKSDAGLSNALDIIRDAHKILESICNTSIHDMEKDLKVNRAGIDAVDDAVTKRKKNIEEGLTETRKYGERVAGVIEEHNKSRASMCAMLRNAIKQLRDLYDELLRKQESKPH